MKVVLVKTPDLHALYLDGEIEEQGYFLGDKNEEELYLLNMAERFKFRSRDVKFIHIDTEDEPYLVTHKWFPRNINLLLIGERIKNNGSK